MNEMEKQQQDAESNKPMEVCSTCGALLVVNDAQQRVDEHVMGKQHMGYARIRVYIDSRKPPPLPASGEVISLLDLMQGTPKVQHLDS